MRCSRSNHDARRFCCSAAPIRSFSRENADERRPAPTSVGALITRRSQDLGGSERSEQWVLSHGRYIGRSVVVLAYKVVLKM